MFTDIENSSNECRPNTSERSTAFQYLKNTVGSIQEQAENWKICIQERANFLEAHDIHDYIHQFPILCTQLGYQLLLQDFDTRFSKESSALYKVWEYLAPAILSVGIRKRDLPADLEKPEGKKC